MLSFKAYGAIVAFPYLLLIVAFHAYLQMYETSPKMSPLQNEETALSGDSLLTKSQYKKTPNGSSSTTNNRTHSEPHFRLHSRIKQTEEKKMQQTNSEKATTDNHRKLSGYWHGDVAHTAGLNPKQPKDINEFYYNHKESLTLNKEAGEAIKQDASYALQQARLKTQDGESKSEFTGDPKPRTGNEQPILIDSHQNYSFDNSHEGINGHSARSEQSLSIRNKSQITSADHMTSKMPRGDSQEAVSVVGMPLQEHCTHTPYDTSVSGQVRFQALRGNFFYSAYFDDRNTGVAVIKIISLIKKNTKPALFCHFIGQEQSRDVAADSKTHVETTPVEHYEMCENHAKDYGGWLLTCQLPVSMTTAVPCNLIISVHRFYDKKRLGNIYMPIFRLGALSNEKKEDFGVCVPPLFGYIPSTTFIEFIEMTRLLGASHFVFYALEISTEVHKVLKYYKDIGIATLLPWNLPVADKKVWYHGQLLAINDCLYRTMHRFQYVAFNDLDEFIVPHKYSNWAEMVKNLHGNGVNSTATKHNNQNSYCGYSFQSAFFDPLSSGTRVLYDLESDLRTKTFSKVRTKVMVMPDRIHELGIHHISKPLHDKLQINHVHPDTAYIHHYRQCMTDFDPKMKCHVYARDERMSPFIPYLRHNVHKVTWLLKEAQKQGLTDFKSLIESKNFKNFQGLL